MRLLRPRVCLIGYGGIGKVHAYAYRNLHLYYNVPRPVLTGIVAKTESSRSQAMQDYDFAWAKADFAEAVNSPDVDIVDCCTPNYLHAPIIELAIKAGKAVYCEKPLAVSVSEAKRLHELAAAHSVPNQVAFNYRFLPAVLTAHDLVRKGKLGKIIHFRGAYYHSSYLDRRRAMSWRLQKQFAGGGALYDLGSHVIDLIRFIIGHDYESVSAILHTEITNRPFSDGSMGTVDVDDLAILQVRTTQGALGTIEASRLASGTEDDLSFEIYGEQGAVRFNLMNPNYLEYFDGNQSRAPRTGAKGFTHLATSSRFPAPARFPNGRSPMGWLQTHIASQADFLLRFLGQQSYGATFADALHVQKVLAAAQISHDAGTWVKLDTLG